MRPLLHPSLINGRYGDPALHVETLFEKHAILFDLGDISALAPRKIHRLEHVFVSHAHIDHFVGFDRLLRVLVGRDKTINLYGPPGFTERVHHKLQGYQWNLVDRYLCELVVIVTEVDPAHLLRRTRFRLKSAFTREEMDRRPFSDGTLHTDPSYRVSSAILEHRTPCLGFALQEVAHVNIWKSRLMERGLPVGPWLRELKRAVIENQPDDFTIRVAGPSALDNRKMSLGSLRDTLTIVPGQKIGYITDVADTPQNRAAIMRLVHGADLLFIEAAFAAADVALAVDRAHLTTTTAGHLARAAGVRRVEPFHFSPRYEGREYEMIAEVMAAFAGDDTACERNS